MAGGMRAQYSNFAARSKNLVHQNLAKIAGREVSGSPRPGNPPGSDCRADIHLQTVAEVASLDSRVVHTIYAQLDARAHEAP